jgi:hypothetical protein
MGNELADRFLPVYDVSDGVAVVAQADAGHAWDELLSVDLVELGRLRPMVGALGMVRALPELAAGVLRGRRPEPPPSSMTLRDLTGLAAGRGGWVLLGERPQQEIALGLVGQFWRPVIRFAEVDGEDFRDFARPGYAKTMYVLGVRPLGPGRCLLTAEMRTATTDDHARRWFRWYWTAGVGPGAHVLARGLLDVARERAEAEVAGVAA